MQRFSCVKEMFVTLLFKTGDHVKILIREDHFPNLHRAYSGKLMIVGSRLTTDTYEVREIINKTLVDCWLNSTEMVLVARKMFS